MAELADALVHPVRSVGVAELADALASGASSRKTVWVQIPSPTLLTGQGS